MMQGGQVMGAKGDPTLKAASIEELKSQKRKQEGQFQELVKSPGNVGGAGNGVSPSYDPALRSLLQLAKHDSEHKRNKVRALKEGTANGVTSSSTRTGISTTPSFRQVAYARPGASKTFNQMSMSDHPRSKRLAQLHQFFEWDQIHTPNKPQKKQTSSRKLMSSKSERHRPTPILEHPSEEFNAEEKWKSKQRSKHRLSRKKSETNELQESLLFLVRSNNTPREEGSGASVGRGLTEYLDKDRAKGKHGSIQDFIERSVASGYSYDAARDLRPTARKTMSSEKSVGKADLLKDFTEKYKALQREQMKKESETLGPKISV